MIRIEFPGHGSRIRPKPLPVSNGQPQKTDGLGVEGEEDGDGLRREYVLVDETNAVEFNRVVDGEFAFPLTAQWLIRFARTRPCSFDSPKCSGDQV